MNRSNRSVSYIKKNFNRKKNHHNNDDRFMTDLKQLKLKIIDLNLGVGFSVFFS